MSSQRTSHGPTMDAFFAALHRHRPVDATFIGVREHDHALPDFSEHGIGDLLADAADLERRLGSDVGASAVEEIDRRLARGFLETLRWETEARHGPLGNPSLYTGEAVFGVMGLFLNAAGSERVRVEAAMARMGAIPEFLAQARENVRSAPPSWTERAIRECDGALAFFTEGVGLLGETLETGPPSRWESAARRAAAGFAEHRAWLETDLLHRPNDAHAAGSEALATFIRSAHFLSRSGDEIRRYAEEQLEEATAGLVERARDFGAATPEEALGGLDELHPSAAGYYARYQEVWDEVRRLAEARDLLTWPDFPIRYLPRPEWSRPAAPSLYFLFYRSPAAVRRPEVHDYLVAPLPEQDVDAFLRANNDSVIRLNHVIHHGGLGHHVQNWHAFRAGSRIGRVAAVDCASRIAMPCGGTMAEGWACYATDLAGEAGMLTPLERYAELRGRTRMCARAIVDVKLHQGEMTLDEAAAFYEARAGMSAAGARGEAVKNSMFPGMALMYLMGTDAIHELRSAMERAAGADFDLRTFHDDFLSWGSIPVTLIAEQMSKQVSLAE